MNTEIAEKLEIIKSNDKKPRANAYMDLMKVTNEKVEWTYEVWDDLLDLLKEGDNHQCSIAAQLLANLTKSDTENRMQKDLDKLIQGTKDEKFVTARHTLQNLWRVGLGTSEIRKQLVNELENRYKECAEEKNGTLIRYDICVVLRKLYDNSNEDYILKKAIELIELEEDPKYRKKYQKVWKDLMK